MTIEAMRRSCAIFKKLCSSDHQFEISRPEVETLLTVTVYQVPTPKQLKELDSLGWSYNEDKLSFSKFF